MVTIEEINYKNFGHCVKVSNGKVQIIATVEIGPRIINYSFVGKENVFYENTRYDINNKPKKYDTLGGHRLWHSPEDVKRTYILDDKKVSWNAIENGIELFQEMEPWAQIEKYIKVELDKDSSKVKLTHRLTNRNAWTIELAAWAISILAPGGVEVIPNSDRQTGVLSNRFVQLWPYSAMDDTRVHFGNKYVTLGQDTTVNHAYKMGLPNEKGWAAYFNRGDAFIKKFKYIENEIYPDNGCSYETFTIYGMTEMESLSPLVKLKPDTFVMHEEEWELFQNINFMGENEGEITSIINKIKGGDLNEKIYCI